MACLRSVWRLMAPCENSLFRGALTLAAFVMPLALAAQTIVPAGSTWRYLVDGSDQGTNWRGAAFDDVNWPVGSAPLGFGEDNLATVMTSGGGPTTTYFRLKFTVADWRALRTLTMRVRLDDGVIVYLNNRVIGRVNLPSSGVTNLTPADATVSGDDESRWWQFGAPPSYLINGTNVLAVELHQSVSGWRDSVFDLALLANIPPSAPSVELTLPEDGSTLPAGPVAMRASASDPDGHVNRVEFYTDGVLVGTDSSEPFEFNWLNAPQGRHLLRVEAIDNSGWRRESATSHVQVGPVPTDRLLRGPYLQSGSSTSIVIRWRTDWFTPGRVYYGTDPNDLDWLAQDTGLETEHAVRITGLRPNTRYYYEISTATQRLAGGEDYWFTTAPTNAQRTRVWAIGDSGTANLNQARVRDAFRNYAGEALANVWLMLGDNAYECGTDDQYQRAVFEVYPEILQRVVLWPTIGNHDAGCYDNGEFPYLDIFHLPARGEAGGTASGTERYYSFDHGNIHFVCLDSQTSSRLADSPMLTWLEQDLAATEKDWIIAYWHHPPYSFGTHDSDVERELIEMRQQIVPVLESYGVDLVLSGHSHNYERSYLLNGHYGFSTDLNPANILNDGFGRPDSGGAYEKPAGGIGAGRGTVYVVCGCSGEGGEHNPRLHPAMRLAQGGFGSMVLDIDGLRLDAKFLTDTGDMADWFSIVKGAPDASTHPTLTIRGEGNRVSLEWPTSLRSYRIESAAGVEPWHSWRTLTVPVTRSGRRNAASVEVNGSNEVFRLKANLP